MGEQNAHNGAYHQIKCCLNVRKINADAGQMVEAMAQFSMGIELVAQSANALNTAPELYIKINK